MAGKIRFFQEDIRTRIPQKRAINDWINQVVLAEKSSLAGDLNIVFCSDRYLLDINKRFLDHDYYTDIITFGGTKSNNGISGDIYISLERVKDNAAELRSKLPDELHRVVVHGVLHLLGYKDKAARDVRQMRSKEDYYLGKRPALLLA